MGKKLLILASAILLMFSVVGSGCKKKEKQPEDVITYLKELGTYSCDFDITVKNDKQELKYNGKQFYDQNIGYRVELGSDRTMIFKDKKIYVSDLKNGSRYVTEEEFDSLLGVTFVGKYIGLIYIDEELRTYYKTINNKKYQLIEVTIPGGIREMNKGVMYVDTEDYLPDHLIVYDVNNKEKLVVYYRNFIPNEEIKKELFNTN